MATKPPERDPEIEKWLTELRSDDPGRREAAAEKIGYRKLRNDEIIKALKVIAETDSEWYAQSAAKKALVSLGVPGEPGQPLSAQLAPLVSRNQKIGLFLAGFVGSFLVNGLLSGLPGLLSSRGNQAASNVVSLFGLVVLLGNVLALIVLAFFPRGRWVALGMLAAIGISLCIIVILGVALAAICFSPGRTF